MPRFPKRTWAFAPRFRRNAFGWRSQPAVARITEAVVEIRKVARENPTLAADGAVLFLTKVSAALAHVDGSSGALGTAVNRAVAKKYPDRSEAEILEDLGALTPKDEGTWFAAAKSAGLYDRALELARSAPCDPRTLTRAARDFLDRNPEFALEAGLTAMHWIAHGIGFEIKRADVVAAYSCTLKAADRLDREAEVWSRVRDMLKGDVSNKKWVGRVVGPLLETRS